MAEIHVLDDSTIDKIAAGEVVERPASVVKELVENAMDAGATAITVEIKEGGIEFIRVTDNGAGIEKAQVKNAFLRHATSKISKAADLQTLVSLGFRGEALSSIAAVAKVELVTKTKDEMTGLRYCLEGGREIECEEVGAPQGTTFIVRNLFFNTPVRRRFLKTAMTEGSYITDLLEHLALSRPEISFKYVLNGQTKFFTNGDGDLKAIIYRIFGREIANETIPFQLVDQELVLEGFLGKPTLNRTNRNFENYFVNGRFVKSKLLSKAIEEGYQPYLMQHRYPFCVIHITVPTGDVDVNVHPTKLEVRFANQNGIYRMIAENISGFLAAQEMIPEAALEEKKKEEAKGKPVITEAPEPFERTRIQEKLLREENRYGQLFAEKKAEPRAEAKSEVKSEVKSDTFFEDNRIQPPKQSAPKEQMTVEKPQQLNFFDEKLLTKEAKQEYRIIGQAFDTYWLIEYREKLLIIDQHAAHEKVKYEQILKRIEKHEMLTQTLTPPVVINVTPREADVIRNYGAYFEELGFMVEDFGMNAYAIRGVPYDLFGFEIKELFESILTELSESPVRGVPQIIREKIASMACKAAVKGNSAMTYEEADTLIEQLLGLENPYHCPHGRPTIVTMSKYEMEKKFKRIV